MNTTLPISIPESRLAEFCREHRIRKLSLFGSVLTDRFRPESDIDVLVEFQPDARIGYLGMVRLQRKLTDLLGRPVDLRTPAELSPYFRDKVVDHAEVQFAAVGEAVKQGLHAKYSVTARASDSSEKQYRVF